MLYYDFQNYAGFQEKFGITHHDNGQKSRRNKILLAYIKQSHLLREAVQSGDTSAINICSAFCTINDRTFFGIDNRSVTFLCQISNYHAVFSNPFIA